jgi:ligand-binding SRPBCC domain-containing protein
MYQLKRQQIVSTDMETCWKFFSSPQNLAVITPAYMRFTVLTEQPEKVYEGLIIAYSVSPVLRIPLKWVTEIKYVKENRFFVDEQRKGPYSLWHHEHHFEQVEDGVLMTDIVSYSLPYGWIGRLAHRLFVKRQLEEVFDYRRKIVEEIFRC